MSANSSTPIDLPPPFRLVSLRELGDAHAHAVAIAPREGAGTLVLVRRFDTAEFAILLEPEEPLASARRALFAVMLAIADALAVAAPPERPIGFAWPATIRIDGAEVGRCRLAWPPDASEGEPPAWLVVSAKLKLERLRGPEAGLAPDETTLADEGFEPRDAGTLVASFARHLMHVLHEWREIGFAAVGRRWLDLLEGEPHASLSVTGDLLLKRPGRPVQRRSLTADLADAGQAPEERA